MFVYPFKSGTIIMNECAQFFDCLYVLEIFCMLNTSVIKVYKRSGTAQRFVALVLQISVVKLCFCSLLQSLKLKPCRTWLRVYSLKSEANCEERRPLASENYVFQSGNIFLVLSLAVPCVTIRYYNLGQNKKEQLTPFTPPPPQPHNNRERRQRRF